MVAVVGLFCLGWFTILLMSIVQVALLRSAQPGWRLRFAVPGFVFIACASTSWVWLKGADWLLAVMGAAFTCLVALGIMARHYKRVASSVTPTDHDR